MLPKGGPVSDPKLENEKVGPHANFLGPILVPFLLKPVLKFFLDGPRADQEHLFSAPMTSKSAPRGKKEASGRHHAPNIKSEAMSQRF